MPKDWKGNKQSVLATLNASCHSKKKRADHDYYATPPQATEALLSREKFQRVWECACGEGHISEVLKSHGLEVYSSDLIDRGYGDVLDFLAYSGKLEKDMDIVTNPPFAFSTEFAYKAMEVLRPKRKLAMLLRIQFLESLKRRKLFESFPPRRIYVFSRNIRCARNGDFENATGNASTYAWFLWTKNLKKNPTVYWL